MNEQLHTDCSILQNKLPAVLPINLSLSLNSNLNRILSIKVHGPDFFKQIVQRYSIITRSGRFPSLILLRLLENAVGTTELTNINKNDIKKILNPSIKQYINLYLTIQSQVNIRTDLAKDTKHVVIPRLMRYLQLIDNQDPVYEFQPVSANTLATTELLRTLPERILSQRVRRENTAILSNNHYPESDIRVMRHTNLDKDDNFVYAGIDKTQASGIQIGKTGTISESQHLKMPDILLFDEYTNPVVADISGVDVSENTKASDIILHPLTHADGNDPKTNTMMAHIQKRNKLAYEKHEGFSKRTADRYLVTEKNNIANKLISNTNIARSRMTNTRAGAGEVTVIPKDIPSKEIPKLLFDQDGIFLQHAGYAQTGMSEPLNFSSNNIIRKSSDLVLRKSDVHSAEKGFENIEKPDIVKAERNKINAENEYIIGTNTQTRDSIDDIANTANIATIADRVYKILETRISIEKERRGLR